MQQFYLLITIITGSDSPQHWTDMKNYFSSEKLSVIRISSFLFIEHLSSMVSRLQSVLLIINLFSPPFLFVCWHFLVAPAGSVSRSFWFQWIWIGSDFFTLLRLIWKFGLSFNKMILMWMMLCYCGTIKLIMNPGLLTWSICTLETGGAAKMGQSQPRGSCASDLLRPSAVWLQLRFLIRMKNYFFKSSPKLSSLTE